MSAADARSVQHELSSRSRFWEHVIKLAAGSAIAQVVVVLTTPLLTRFYTPHDFGVSAVVISLLAFLGPVSSLNYYQAIVLPSDDRDALRVAEVSLVISVIAAALLAVAFFGFRHHLAATFKSPELVPIFWVVPIAVFVRSAYHILSSWMSRERRFGLQARARVAQALTDRALSLATGFIGMASSMSLLFSRLLGVLAEALVLAVAFVRSTGAVRGRGSGRSMRELAEEYREFPRYSSWAMLLANGSSQLPVLLLPVLFAPDICGLYALADRLIQTPMQLVGESIRNVYYKELADRAAQGREIRSSFIRLRTHLVVAGSFPFAILLVFGEVIFGTLFGPEWRRAGAFSGIIGFYLFFQFISAPIASLFNAHRRQRYLMVISGLMFANNAISLFVGKWLGSPEGALVLMSINGIGIYLLMNYLAEGIVGARHTEQFVTYGRALLLNAPFVGAMYLLTRGAARPFALVAACAGLCACYYLLAFRAQLASMLRRRSSR